MVISVDSLNIEHKIVTCKSKQNVKLPYNWLFIPFDNFEIQKHDVIGYRGRKIRTFMVGKENKDLCHERMISALGYSNPDTCLPNLIYDSFTSRRVILQNIL